MTLHTHTQGLIVSGCDRAERFVGDLTVASNVTKWFRKMWRIWGGGHGDGGGGLSRDLKSAPCILSATCTRSPTRPQAPVMFDHWYCLHRLFSVSFSI